MKEIATISCEDIASSGEALVIIRSGSGTVALCISLREDGDVEVLLGLDDCERVLKSPQ